ncbi:MAG: c-type cytochrome [Xanthomonadales bacterium]|nr:c-type cytochrome [Xanthomonadales bacterium]
MNIRNSLALLIGMVLLCEQDVLANSRSSTINVSPNGSLVVVVNNDSRSVTFIELPHHEIRAEIIVGRDPRNVVFSLDGNRAFVTNRWDDSLSVIDIPSLSVEKTVELCDEPSGVVALDDGRVIANCYGSGQVAVVDPDDGEVTDILDVNSAPAGMAFDTTRNLLYVTHFIDGQVTVIDPVTLQIVNTISTGTDSNLVNSIVISPDAERAWIPHQRSNVGNEALLFDTTVFPVVTAVDLDTQAQVFDARIHLDISDEPVNMPFDAIVTGDNEIWVLNSGSNDISVINLEDGKGIAHIEVGHNPRGMALSPDGSTIYVNNNLSGTVSAIDTVTYEVKEEFEVTEIALTRAVLNGKRLFHSSNTTDLALDQWISCATCHFDGEMDSRTWFFPDGPRNTSSLLGVAETLPVHWSGDLDELQDVEITIRDIQAGTGLAEGNDHCDPACDLGPPNSGRSRDLDDLAEYMVNLEFSPNPNRLVDGSLDEAAVRGKTLFESDMLECSECHPSPLYTDLKIHDVGTGLSTGERKGSEFDTPSLRGIYKTAPYLHDGSAGTLRDVLTRNNPANEHGTTSHLSGQEVDDLIAFMRSLSGEDSVFVINPGLNDAWMEVGKPGQGFFMTVLQDAGIVFLAWFTFDTERSEPGDAILGSGGHRWLTAQGPFERSKAELEVYLSMGGVFDSNAPEVNTERYGSIRLEFTGCNAGTVIYNIPGLELEGVIPIERIVTDNVEICEQFVRSNNGIKQKVE